MRLLGEGGQGLHEWAVALWAWREQHQLKGGEVNPSPIHGLPSP